MLSKKGRAESTNGGDAALFFNDAASDRYAASSPLQATQQALTARCLDLVLAGPQSTTPRLVLDLGCGCGFSSAALRWRLPAGSIVVGLDISLGMLAACTVAERVGGSMAQLPLRSGPLFDAAVSVSALQWLESPADLLGCFLALRSCCTAAARAVLQFYPKDAQHAAATIAAARQGGWLTARLLCCFPQIRSTNIPPQRKWFCCVGPAAEVPAEVVAGVAPCPLAWPYDATCAMCWGWEGAPLCGPADTAWSTALIDGSIEQHLRLSCRLVRLWRREQAGLEARPSACEQALLASGIAAQLAATVPQCEGAATATALKEALRAAWWCAGRDAMHGAARHEEAAQDATGAARHEDSAGLAGMLGAASPAAESVRSDIGATSDAGERCDSGAHVRVPHT